MTETSGERWRVMTPTIRMKEYVTWVVKKGHQPWSVNAQPNEAQDLADYLNTLEAEVKALRELVREARNCACFAFLRPES